METKEKIKVLQIGAKDGTSLATLYQQENSTLGYYLKAAENTMNVKFDIETVDSKVLTQRFEKNPDCLNPCASVPAPGSVRPKAPSFSPFARGTRYFCFCSSVP